LSQDLERVYTINLGKVLLSPNNQRAKRAINMVKEFARHHMKTERVKIEEDLSHQIWHRGIRHPPRKIRVRLSKTDEGFVLISPYEEEVESKVKPVEEKKKLEEKDTIKEKSEIKEIKTTEEIKQETPETKSEIKKKEVKKTTEPKKPKTKELPSKQTKKESKKKETKKQAKTKTTKSPDKKQTKKKSK